MPTYIQCGRGCKPAPDGNFKVNHKVSYDIIFSNLFTKTTFITFIFVLAISIFAQGQNLQGKIVYSHHNSFAAANPDSIFSIDNNGQSKRFVTLGFRPRISHNGNYMAFSNGPLPNNSIDANLWMRNLITQKDTQIVANGDYLDYYDFSPDDSEMVYSQGCSMFTAKINGTNSYHDVGCTPCDCYSDDPTVRRSDSMIVFHNVHFGIFTKNYDGSNIQLFPNTVQGDLFPIWSPDGQWIAYYKTTPGLYYTTNTIYKAKPDGTDTTRLTFFSITDTLAPDPIWAKDMQSIYFIANIHDTIGIYKVLTDGSGVYKRVYTFGSLGSINDYWMGLSDSISSVLPVTLINFTGKHGANAVDLSWQTVQEFNSNYFSIERSRDGINFSTIGSVAAKGNSNTLSNYMYADDLSSAVNDPHFFLMYRLKMVDKDGKYAYSKVISVKVAADGRFAIFPNPGNGSFTISANEVNKQMDVLIINEAGQKVYHQSFKNTSSKTIRLNLPKALYWMKITGDRSGISQPIVINPSCCN